MFKEHFPVNRIDCNLHTTLLQDGKRVLARPNNRPEICKNHFDASWDPRDDYHVYGVENSKDWIVWYIDGKEVAKKPNLYWHLPIACNSVTWASLSIRRLQWRRAFSLSQIKRRQKDSQQRCQSIMSACGDLLRWPFVDQRTATRTTMRAMQLTEYKKLELVEVDKPEIGPKDVLVEIRACGICGSDVHGYDGSSGRRIPPLVMGHEAAGVIVAVGDEVTKFSVDQRVTFDSMISCDDCPACENGRHNLCQSRRVLGVSCETYRRNGCFAEFVQVPEHIVYAIPDELAFEHAALVEPVSVAIHAVSLLDVPDGSTGVRDRNGQ